MISLHTSPVDQPGTGDAGGMNTYVLQSALALARRGVPVDLATGTSGPARVGEVASGVRLYEVPVVPSADLAGTVAAAQAFGRAVAATVPRADVVHGHYWLSGVAAAQIAPAWGAAFVESSHTLAAVKSAALGQAGAEPALRVDTETYLARVADRLVANTRTEAGELVSACGADPARVSVVEPGVDLSVFTPGLATAAGYGALLSAERAATRAELGVDPVDPVVAYVGRLQPLKGPDVVVRAAGPLVGLLAAAGRPRRLTVLVCGAPAGRAVGELDRLRALAAQAPDGVTVRFVAPRPSVALARLYRAVDVVAVPSRSESFGLVALEAQACGVPVLAAAVGGLPRAVAPGVAALVPGHDPQVWAAALAGVLTDPGAATAMRAAGLEHAAGFSWDRTAEGLLGVYRQARQRSAPDPA